MPIGQYDNFADLKRAVQTRARHRGARIRSADAYTAAVADKIEPGWREEAEKKKKLRAAAWRRLSRRRRAT